MNSLKSLHVFMGCALFGLGLTLTVLNFAPVPAAGAFVGCGLLGIANALSGRTTRAA